MLPESILGETFLEKYIDHSDAVTVIDEKRTYVVRAPAKHPIYENFRVKAFKALLTSTSSDEQLTALGELLYQGGNSFDIAVIEIFIGGNFRFDLPDIHDSAIGNVTKIFTALYFCNFLVSKEPPHRPILLDFGLTKRISSSMKHSLAKMFLATAEGDHVALLSSFSEMGLKLRLDFPEQAMDFISVFFHQLPQVKLLNMQNLWESKEQET
ncbi:hypothetical protein OIU84_000038 [Salix udensis]|uniref:Uncharacterized protein n=1 Tax=Salix udensis TaxID=889485 RepID=A0AAD6L5C2_9ROSI|nr:hypothetical protein OIU84_000038 [Salix udensis]